MKITVEFVNAALTRATVCGEPNWLERVLLGARAEHEIMACMAPAPAGGRLWLWDSTGRRIANRRIVDAIERARNGALAAQRQPVTR